VAVQQQHTTVLMNQNETLNKFFFVSYYHENSSYTVLLPMF